MGRLAATCANDLLAENGQKLPYFEEKQLKSLIFNIGSSMSPK